MPKLDEVKVVLAVGQQILDEVKKGADEEAKKELKLKRSLWKYTGKRR